MREAMPDTIGWKERAAALRAAAEHAADPVTQESLLLLAEDCDAFAEEKDEARRRERVSGPPSGRGE
jgi:hypothetical protein